MNEKKFGKASFKMRKSPYIRLKKAVFEDSKDFEKKEIEKNIKTYSYGFSQTQPQDDLIL